MDSFRRSLREIMAPALLQEFGEPIAIIPRHRPPNRSSVADPTRREQQICGIFAWPSEFATRAGDMKVLLSPMTVTRAPTFSIPTDALTWTPRVGDWIMRRTTGHMFEITASFPDGAWSIKFECLQLGLPDAEIGPAPSPEPETIAPQVNVNAPKPAVKKVVARKKQKDCP